MAAEVSRSVGTQRFRGPATGVPGLLLEIADANHVVGLPEIDRKGLQAMYVVQAAEPIFSFLGDEIQAERERRKGSDPEMIK